MSESRVVLITGSTSGMGFAAATYNITQVSLRQAIVPQRLQGRMHATMRFLGWSTQPLGALCGGLLGETCGVRHALVVAAVGGMTAFLWLLGSPVRHLHAPAVPRD